jgi:hypothetical protein
MQEKLDQKDEDYYMVPIDTFLDYLNPLPLRRKETSRQPKWWNLERF